MDYTELKLDRDKWKEKAEISEVLLVAWGRVFGFEGEDDKIIKDLEHIGRQSPKEVEWEREKEVMFAWLVELTRRDSVSKEYTMQTVKIIIENTIKSRKNKK